MTPARKAHAVMPSMKRIVVALAVLAVVGLLALPSAAQDGAPTATRQFASPSTCPL
ncbi:MAG: hypothetical protein M3O36_09070 [Myxococcota bacterium]|nr:hypothetical protein [Myxococcota bacterium]